VETRLKLIKNAKRELTHEPKPHALNVHSPGGPPRPARAAQLNAPSGEVHLARGLNAPSGEVRLARGPLHARHPRSCSRARAFNALTPQDCATTLTRLGITPRHCSTDSLGKTIPPLYDTVRRGQCQPRDTVPPTFVRLTRRALEGGGPSNGGGCFFYGYTGLHRDVRPAGTVFFVAVSLVRPSPPLQRRAGYYDDIPNAVEAHGDMTSPRPPLYLVRTPSTPPSSRPADGGRAANLRTTTLEAAPVWAQDSPRRPNRSEIRQDGRQLHGTVRHAFTRRRTVWHACKLLSLLGL
jgi:hypothetical protein